MVSLSLPNPTCLLKSRAFSLHHCCQYHRSNFPLKLHRLPRPKSRTTFFTGENDLCYVSFKVIFFPFSGTALSVHLCSHAFLLQLPSSTAFFSSSLPSLSIIAQRGYFILPGGTRESKTRTTRTKSKLFITKPISKETTGR